MMVQRQEVVRADFNSQFLKIRKEENDVFIFSYALSDSGEAIEFYKLRYKQLSKIYSNTRNNIGWGDFYIINENLYFVLNKDIYRYMDYSFVKQFSIEYPNFGTRFFKEMKRYIYKYD